MIQMHSVNKNKIINEKWKLKMSSNLIEEDEDPEIRFSKLDFDQKLEILRVDKKLEKLKGNNVDMEVLPGSLD
jgi:hypothetical protein